MFHCFFAAVYILWPTFSRILSYQRQYSLGYYLTLVRVGLYSEDQSIYVSYVLIYDFYYSYSFECRMLGQSLNHVFESLTILRARVCTHKFNWMNLIGHQQHNTRGLMLHTILGHSDSTTGDVISRLFSFGWIRKGGKVKICVAWQVACRFPPISFFPFLSFLSSSFRSLSITFMEIKWDMFVFKVIALVVSFRSNRISVIHVWKTS